MGGVRPSLLLKKDFISNCYHIKEKGQSLRSLVCFSQWVKCRNMTLRSRQTQDLGQITSACTQLPQFSICA